MTINIYQRAFSIHIDNPLDGQPTCTFQQERVAEVNGEIIRQPIGELKVVYNPDDPTSHAVYSLLRDFYLGLIAPPVEEVVESVTEEPVTEEVIVNG